MENAGAQHRCFAARRPGALEGRNRRKSAFVHETQVGAEVIPLFLSLATGITSNAQRRRRHVTTPDVAAFDSSSPCDAADATPRWDGSAPQTAPRSRESHGRVSSNPRRTRAQTPPFQGAFQTLQLPTVQKASPASPATFAEAAGAIFPLPAIDRACGYPDLRGHLCACLSFLQQRQPARAARIGNCI